MVIIIMGPQGSGKTTQAEKLSEAFNIPHLESGEIFREIAREDSGLGRRIKKALENGQLVDSKDSDTVIEAMFTKARFHDHVIVDGFPRDLEQARTHKGKIDRVFYLDVGHDECVRRLKARARSDDTPELIDERLRLYYDRTIPVLDWFEELGVLEKIKGERPPEVILNELHDRIRRMLQIGEVELLQ
ncbi:MAG: nucleoside monophosphate kinase [bacterium]|nr:nucleoside monophosphate kinase [bacterium]